LLTILVDKGHLRYERDGKRYIYEPVAPREHVSRNALGRLLATFFENSAANLVATLLNPADRKLDAKELARLESLIDDHRKSSRRASRAKSPR
jgi:predicted transcriptional regulator